MDGLLVSLAKAIEAAIEAERTSGDGFEVNDFLLDWEWGGRAEEELKEGSVFVRVVVPPSYVFAELQDRAGTWNYGAAMALEIRSKIGPVYQEADDATPERERLSALSRLVEELHEFFPSKLTERSITLTDHSKTAEWVDERDQLKSEINVLGAVKRLHENRTFLGVLTEAFDIA
jgi:hypothetical protein